MYLSKILLVDDDFAYAASFKENLSRFFDINILTKPEDIFLNPEQAASFDAVIVDIHMPKFDGFNICLELKRKTHQVPLLFILTSDKTESACLTSLHLKVEDFLEKSMPWEEIRMRIKNRILSRIRVSGSLLFNKRKAEVQLNGTLVHLTQVERSILEELLDRDGQPVARETLASVIWKNRNVVDHTLNSHVHNLNKKLKGWEFSVKIDKTGLTTLEQSDSTAH